MNGAFGVNLHTLLVTATDRDNINTAVGGSTLNDVLTRISANPSWYILPLAIWDGIGNGYGTPAAYLAIIDQIVALVGGPSRLIMPAPVVVGPPSGTTAALLSDMQTIATGIVDRGILTFDAQSILVANNSVADATSTAAGLVGPGQTFDGVHLVAASMNLIVPYFVQNLNGLDL